MHQLDESFHGKFFFFFSCVCMHVFGGDVTILQIEGAIGKFSGHNSMLPFVFQHCPLCHC